MYKDKLVAVYTSNVDALVKNSKYVELDSILNSDINNLVQND